MTALSDLDRRVLAFERQWFARPGSREQAILDEFNLTPTRYAQTLNVLIDRPEALAADPQTVRRLQRIRAHRAQARGA